MKQNVEILKRFPFGGHKVRILVGKWPCVNEASFCVIHCKPDWPRWNLIYTIGGRGIISWPGGQAVMLPGTAMLMASNTEYTYSADPAQKLWHQYSAVFLPRAYWHDWFDWPELALGIMSLQVPDATDGRVQKAFQNACDIASTPHLDWEDFAMAAVELVLLEFHELNKETPRRKHHTDPRLQRAIEFMEQHYSSAVAREEIARAAGVSPPYLNALFQKHMNTSPMHYLDTLRINKAQQLLRETAEPVAKIGELCGFSSPAYFSDRFRKLTGHAPKVYRKRIK